MPSLTLKDVEHIAHLARLALTDEEKVTYRDNLVSVLDYAEMLNELDLEDVPPTTHAVARHNVLRDDVVNASLSTAEALANAAQHTQNQFAIQAVLEE